MINDQLNIPDHYRNTTNGFLAQYLYNASQKLKKGTFAWDFVRYVFEMENVSESEYEKLYKELFETAFLSEESCKEWIDTKIVPLLKNVDYSITCYLNDNKWKYSCVRPSKFRDYHNHRNVFVPCLIMVDSEGTEAVFATSAAFDAYDSYEDLPKIENFSGIIKSNVALTGVALYKNMLEGYKKSKARIKKSSGNVSDGVKVSYTFDIPLITEINRKRFNELKNIKNNNAFKLEEEFYPYSGLQFPQPTVIASIKGSVYKELFRILGTRDGDGIHTIPPENSSFPPDQIIRRTGINEKDILLSPETILKHIKDNEIYWIELEGWHRISIPLLPDGRYKKRWQSQFHLINPNSKFDAREWMIETIQGLTYKDKLMYHLTHGDNNLEFYSDKNGKSLEWWLNTFNRIDKLSYDLSWSIDAEHWNTKKLIF